MNIDEIKKVLVIGAGTMGHSIAQVYAQKGIEVNLVDLNQKKLKHAITLIKSNLNTLAKFGRVPHDEISVIIKRIHLFTEIANAAKETNLAMEAVNEKVDIKKKVFSQLDKYCSEDAIIASNTSGLDIFSIADVKQPERLIIHHWCAPPHIIPLVEIVPGPNTSQEIIKFSTKLLESLGKKPVVLKNFFHNFIVNRIQSVIYVQVYEMLKKGWATAEQIDLAVKANLGLRIPILGVVQTQDFTGLDLVLDKQKEFRINRNYPQVEELVKKGHFGVKSGKGFYDYGGRSEAEILKKRDEYCLQILETLEKLNTFKPI